MSRVSLLILEHGLRDPLTASQACDLLEILVDCCGCASKLAATRVDVVAWRARFPEPILGDAALDILIHSAYRLELRDESMQ